MLQVMRFNVVYTSIYICTIPLVPVMFYVSETFHLTRNALIECALTIPSLLSYMIPLPASLPPVDQSMFENSNASRSPGQGLQASRLTQASARRSLVTANPALGGSPAEAPSSTTTNGGQQRLKNALNLGKVVGAKVNDLLRRKEPSLLGDIGVTEVNKNVGAVWSNMEEMTLGTTANR